MGAAAYSDHVVELDALQVFELLRLMIGDVHTGLGHDLHGIGV